ncbi:unnamed protein product [Schistosoma turkestanicum]|nr:unnamed protein product [Schistosoma turkestanicum]
MKINYKPHKNHDPYRNIELSLFYLALKTHGGFAQGIQTRQINSQSLKIIPLYAPNFYNTPKSDFLKNEIVEKALAFWQNALSVKRPSNRNILIRRDCVNDRHWFTPLKNGSIDIVCEQTCLESAKCHTMQVPKNYLQACRTRSGTSGFDGSGIPGNGYIMIIDASPAGLCNDEWLIAYANSCQLEGNTDRPVLGFINFCPNRLDEKYPFSKMLLYTAIHEIGHALGFNRNLYAFYRDESGKPRTQRDRVTGMPNTKRGEFGVFAPSNKSTDPWCDYFDTTRAKCVSYNKAYNYCNMLRYPQPVSPEKQHVKNHKDGQFLAGDSKLHDGCAFFQPMSNIRGTDHSSVCTHEENNSRLGQNPLMQHFGPNSMCVGHGENEIWVLNTNGGVQYIGDMGASCHKYECGNGLAITIGRNIISCPQQGGTVALNAQMNLGLIKGYVECPPCKQVCRQC